MYETERRKPKRRKMKERVREDKLLYSGAAKGSWATAILVDIDRETRANTRSTSLTSTTVLLFCLTRSHIFLLPPSHRNRPRYVCLFLRFFGSMCSNTPGSCSAVTLPGIRLKDKKKEKKRDSHCKMATLSFHVWTLVQSYGKDICWSMKNSYGFFFSVIWMAWRHVVNRAGRGKCWNHMDRMLIVFIAGYVIRISVSPSRLEGRTLMDHDWNDGACHA